MSSKIDHESGVVTITGAGYTWAAPGHRLYVGSAPYNVDLAARRFDDYIARLALSQSSNGHAYGEGVKVKPPEWALLEGLRAA